MKSIVKHIIICAGISLVFAAANSSAQLISSTVNDGGFESITAKSDFASPTSGAASIPYWGATLVSTTGAAVGAPTDSGAEQDPVSSGTTADNYATHSGTAGAFWQPAGSSTAFNLETGATITANTVYTLTWYGRETGTGGAQYASLYTQPTSTVGAAYTYQPDATVASVNGLTNATYALDAGHAFTQYTLTYTSTAANAGDYIGLTYGSSGSSFIAADDFTLTATPVPEPSTCASIAACAGLLGSLLVRRSKCATI